MPAVYGRLSDLVIADITNAPWTADQVRRLNAWQHSDGFHPYTCGCGAVLRASPEGWRCDRNEGGLDDSPKGRLVQFWAHTYRVNENPLDTRLPLAGCQPTATDETEA